MTAAPPSASLRIFIVENHGDTLRSLKLYLEQMGHFVFTARTMKDAIADLPAAHCDMLISDIGLPDGSGWELMEQVDLPDDVFTVAISGFGTESDRARSREAGFLHHMTKPADPEELDLLVAEAVAGKRKS